MRYFTRFAILLALATFVFACLPEEQLVESPTRRGFSPTGSLTFSDEELAILNEELSLPQQIALRTTSIPAHISNASFDTPTVEQQSESDARKAVLGRVLFYDTRLSATGETSCATCHLQTAAFADNLKFSDGINGQVTKRNSLALGSVPSFAPAVSGYGSSGDESAAAVEGEVKFFWDERAETIMEQSRATIQDEREMGKDIHELSTELADLRMYQILSMKAYGTTELTPDRITLALEKFTSSISSMNTRFDQFRNQTQFGDLTTGDFTASEIEGARLFDTNCALCHGASLTKPNLNVANNGLDLNSPDAGIGAITGLREDRGVFKVPFLRNIALTAPYMHDGRFATLREVIDHYSEGIQAHPNLSFALREDFSGGPVRMDFSEEEKQALIDFLLMTTDEEMLADEAYSNPFRR